MDMAAQPDFHRVVTGFTMVTEEMERCVNLPVVQQGNEVLQALVAINARLDRMETKSEARYVHD